MDDAKIISELEKELSKQEKEKKAIDYESAVEQRKKNLIIYINCLEYSFRPGIINNFTIYKKRAILTLIVEKNGYKNKTNIS